MGIQGYYDWLKTSYPEVFSELKKSRRYDHVMIDMNHIFHNAINSATTEKGFVVRIYRALDFLLSRCLATKSIYLAVDGPPPYSKIALQRKRRGMVDAKSAKKKMSSLCLTPGTVMMRKLEQYLEKYFVDRQSWYRHRKIKLTISPAAIAGEGEIKIFKEIQKIAQTSPKDSFLVVGNDADLVVLAMASKPAYNVDILVRVQFKHFFVSINALIMRHNRLVRPKWKVKKCFSLRNSLLRYDFAALSIMMGNDYLKRLYYTKPVVLWETYVVVKKQRKTDFLLQEDGTFNREFLLELMEQIIGKLANQYQKLSHLKYKKTDVKGYLSGVIWCVKMYQDGVCPKVDYLFEKNPPSPTEIVHFLKTEGKLPEIPISNTLAVSHDRYPLLVMPQKAKHLLTQECQDLMDTEMTGMYDMENCEDCLEIRGRLSLVHKALRRAQLAKEDTVDARQGISKVSKEFNAHKKTHAALPSISEIVAKVNGLKI